MNIIVCVKPVPDISIVSLDPFAAGKIDPDDLVYTVNPSDMVAVEEAVRIKESYPSCRVILLSVAPPSQEKLLRRCLAVGADEGILLWDDHFTGSDSHATGIIIAKAVGSMPYDLILCGNMSIDAEAGMVGYVVANRLDLPMVSRVTEIHFSPPSKKIDVERKLTGGYREKMEVPLPALLAVEEGLNEPRYPGLPPLIAALRKNIQRCDMKALGLSADEVGARGSKTRVVGISAPKPRPKKPFTPDSSLSAFERLRLVMSGGVEGKREEVFQGSHEDLSKKFIKYLNQLGILEGE